MIVRIWVIVYIVMVTSSLAEAEDHCVLPKELFPFTQTNSQKSLLKYSDIKRNTKYLRSLCTHKIVFTEGRFKWEMLLVYNPNHKKGPFWFLPHDNENSAFDAAIYAVDKYGGGLLSVLSSGDRYFHGQDPNRNFGTDIQTAQICSKQKYPAPLYSKVVFNIIDTYRGSGFPYLALHNNSDGWIGNGGSGTISILKSSASVQSYPSGTVYQGKAKGISDEDSLIYIAGTEKIPPQKKLKVLNHSGIHIKYEVVSKKNNDCSMSNYVVLKKGGNYYNIETEHGDVRSQKKMIDKLMNILNIHSR